MIFANQVLFEDNHLLVVNKRAGELSQGDQTGDKTLVDAAKDYIKWKYQKPGEVFLGIPHRIDRPVSGALILARTSKALSRLTEQLRSREIKKTYWAVVKNKPPKISERLVMYLKKNPKNNKTYAQKSAAKDHKESILSYRLLHSSERYHLLEIDLETGRHHQIRCMLSAIGCPIKGDLKYGFDRSNPDGSIHLHARKAAFIHPVKKEPIQVIAPVPAQDELWAFFERSVVD